MTHVLSLFPPACIIAAAIIVFILVCSLLISLVFNLVVCSIGYIKDEHRESEHHETLKKLHALQVKEIEQKICGTSQVIKVMRKLLNKYYEYRLRRCAIKMAKVHNEIILLKTKLSLCEWSMYFEMKQARYTKKINKKSS